MSTPYPGGPPDPRWPPAGAPPAGPPAQWGPPPAGPPQWGPPPGAPSGGRRGGLVVGLVAGLVVLALVAVAAAVVLSGSEDDDRADDLGSGPRSEPEEAWTEELDLPEDAEVAVVADRERVFTLVSTFEGEGTLTAWSADDGDELWREEVAVPAFADDPVPLGDALFVTEQDDEGIDSTRLLDAATGEEIWEADGKPSTGYASFGPTIATPLAAADPILFEDAGGDDGHVAAVDRATGEVLWEEDAGEAVPCGDVVVAARGESTEVGGEIVAWSLDEGEELWTAEGGAGGCDDDVVALSTATDEVAILDVRSGEERTVIELPDGSGTWRGAPFGDHVVVNRITFGSDEEEGTIDAAIHPIEGGDATWEGEAIAGALDEERVLLVTEDEDLVIIRPDGEEIGSVAFEEGPGCNAFTPEIVLGCDEDGGPVVTAFAIAGAPEEIWSVDVGDDVRASALGGDALYVATDDQLIALR